MSNLDVRFDNSRIKPLEIKALRRNMVGPGGVPSHYNFKDFVCPADLKVPSARKRQFSEVSSRAYRRCAPSQTSNENPDELRDLGVADISR